MDTPRRMYIRSPLAGQEINPSSLSIVILNSLECRWYYAEGIQVDEAYVFVCYDSRKNRARFTPHTGLRDHSVGPDAPPRESVELRSYCFWENELAQEFDREL
jgi:hypothetical protein